MGVVTIDRDKPSYRVVYEHFRKRSVSAGSGIRIPSRAELAKQFAVGETTVTRAIDLLKKNGFAYGRQGRGTYICQPGQKSQKLQQIGFVTSSLELEIIRYSRGFERVFRDENYSVSIHSSPIVSKLKNVIEHIAGNGLSGIMLLGLSSVKGISEIDISSLVESKIPVVTIGGSWPGLNCDKVEHTRRDSAKRMAEHAATGGCRTPGVVLESSGNAADNAAFLDELRYSFESRNIKIKEENIFYYQAKSSLADNPDFCIDSYNLMKKEFAKISQCDVLMFNGDYEAVGALHALRENGTKIPEQIKLISGYRGMRPEDIHEKPTTVDTNVEEQARIAAELLKKRIEGYDGPMESHYVAGELIEGRTT